MGLSNRNMCSLILNVILVLNYVGCISGSCGSCVLDPNHGSSLTAFAECLKTGTYLCGDYQYCEVKVHHHGDGKVDGHAACKDKDDKGHWIQHCNHAHDPQCDDLLLGSTPVNQDQHCMTCCDDHQCVIDLANNATATTTTAAATNPPTAAATTATTHSTKPAVDGGLGAWGAWSVCSMTCGGGDMVRTRPCDSPQPQQGGAPCASSDLYEIKRCNLQLCPTTTTAPPTTTLDPFHVALLNCSDVKSNCTAEDCYVNWAPAICRKTCHLCLYPSQTYDPAIPTLYPPPPTTTTTRTTTSAPTTPTTTKTTTTTASTTATSTTITPTTAISTASAPTTTAVGCVDHVPDCATMTNICANANGKLICPVTCNGCPSITVATPPTTTPNPCADHLQGMECKDVQGVCSNAMATVACPKYCGLCTP